MSSLKRLAAVVAAAGLALSVAGAAAAPVADGSARVAVTHAAALPEIHPMIRATSGASVPTISVNWSGYAATSTKKFNYVHSEFVQPKVKCPGKPYQYSSNWVGLDGFNDQTVEQDGTFAYCGGKTYTTPTYVAWYEMYPGPSALVFKVQPGDIISTTVAYKKGTFTLTVSDLSSGKTSTTTAECSTCKRDSAEWIVERPALCTKRYCTLASLADFGLTTMDDNIARAGGGSAQPLYKFPDLYPIYMVGLLRKGFISLDEVSGIDSYDYSFALLWDRPGQPLSI